MYRRNGSRPASDLSRCTALLIPCLSLIFLCFLIRRFPYLLGRSPGAQEERAQQEVVRQRDGQVLGAVPDALHEAHGVHDGHAQLRRVRQRAGQEQLPPAARPPPVSQPMFPNISRRCISTVQVDSTPCKPQETLSSQTRCVIAVFHSHLHAWRAQGAWEGS